MIEEQLAVAAEKKSDDATPEVPTFEEALERLESIVVDLEEGEIGLAEGLARYEQGVKLRGMTLSSVSSEGSKTPVSTRTASSAMAPACSTRSIR